MAPLPYILSGERVVGQGNGLYADTLNRALQAMLTQSGYGAMSGAGTPGVLGPAHNPYGYGAIGDGNSSHDDAPKIKLAHDAAVADGGEFCITTGTYYCGTNETFTNPVTIRRGAMIKPALGVTITFNGAVHAGPFPWIDLSLGGKVLLTSCPTSLLSAIWFKEITVTVPAPTNAPVGLAAVQDATPFGPSAFVAGHTYEYGYTFVGYDGGETLISPLTQYVVSAGGFEAPMIQFFGTLTCRAMAVSIYWRDVTAGGTLRKMTGGGNWGAAGATQTTQWGFGDITDAQGVLGVRAVHNNDTPLYSGVANAHDRDGTVLTTPTVAPVINIAQVLPISTTFYAAYSYVCQDGTETALSPIAGPVTTGVTGGCLRFKRQTLPPPGAMSVNVYAGLTNVTLKKQFNAPLHHLAIQVNSYNAAGAANSVGARQSTISPLQQAWTCVHDSGGGRSILVDSLQQTYVPLIFGQSDGNANGISVRGMNGAMAGNQQRANINYVGPAQSNLVFIVASASAGTFENLAFWDPNSRLAFGVAYCDPDGGKSFYQVWNHVSVSAMAVGGIGLQSSNHSVGASHTASEQKFNSCSFSAGAWCIDLRGQQTANFRFNNLQTFSFGGINGDMNGGDMRIMNPNVIIHEHFAGAHAMYVYFIGSEVGPVAGGGAARLVGTDIQCELDNGGPMYLYMSDTDLVGADVTIIEGGVLNNLGRNAYDIYCGSQSKIVGINTYFGNCVFLDNYAATLVTLGMGVNKNQGAIFKQSNRFNGPLSTGYPPYYPPLVLYSGGVAFVSPTGAITELRQLSGTKATVDPALLANLATQLVTTMTVTGAVIGDAVDSVVHSAPLGTYFFGVVTAADTVTVYQSNFTGAGVDVASGTLTAIVTKKVQ